MKKAGLVDNRKSVEDEKTHPSINFSKHKGAPLPGQHLRLTGSLNGLIRALAGTYYAYLSSN